MELPQPAGPAEPGLIAAGISRIPIELHGAWLQYLSQPEILRIGLLSTSWRALVLSEPHFYLCIRLRAIRGHQKGFIRRLQHAANRRLPVGVILDFPYAPTKFSRSILASAVAPEIVRAMPRVKKLSIICGAPLPDAAIEFLQQPAPVLREFTYRIDPNLDRDEDEYHSASCSDSGFYGYCGRVYTTYVRLPPIGPRLFACSAPRLTTVNLYGITLPEQPAAAFAKVTNVKLGKLQPIPALGLDAHFPAARHLKLTTHEDDFSGPRTCSRDSWLPQLLVTFDLDDSAIILGKLTQLANLAAVPHLRIRFDAHYVYENIGGVTVIRARDPTRRFDARDADWAACVAHLAQPRQVEIYSSSASVPPSDVHITVRSAGDVSRSVTFYADDRFGDKGGMGKFAEYAPLASLKCLSGDLESISVPHAHLPAIFSISQTLPALREIHVTLSGSTGAAFWNEPSGAVELACPALERLVLSSGPQVEGFTVQSAELAQFGRSIGLSATNRPRLVLRGVSVQGSLEHADVFAT